MKLPRIFRSDNFISRAAQAFLFRSQRGQFFTLFVTVLGLLTVAVSFVPTAFADEIYTFVVKKQEAKAQSHWSLSEWLVTRDKMRLMDLWLALHTPSPYEFYLSADYVTHALPVDSSPTGWRGQVAAYASIFGLSLQRQFAPAADWIGLFELRLIGYHSQGTNLTLQGGLRSQKPDPALAANRNAVAGAALTLYLNRFFGIEGLYRHFFSGTNSQLGYSNSGNRQEAGAFIDFNFVRVYGDFYHESESRDKGDGSAAGSNASQGALLGTRLYF